MFRHIITPAIIFCLASTGFASDCSMKNHSSTTSAAQSVAPTTKLPASAPTEKISVNINTATLTDLVNINGMNEAKAKSILSYRKKHGDFKSLDELKSVRGFKKMDAASLKSIQNQMRI